MISQEVLTLLKQQSPENARRRIQQAMDETQRLIDREMNYSPQFRKIGLLVEWGDHMAKLQVYMAEINDD
jgi:hypothetical protein